MNKLINKIFLISCLTLFYSDYSLAVCQKNPRILSNVYVPDRTIYVQYDMEDGILETIDIPFFSSNYSFTTSNSDKCNPELFAWLDLVWGTGVHKATTRYSNLVSGVGVSLDLHYSSPRTGNVISHASFRYPIPEKTVFSSMSWRLFIKKTGTIKKSGKLESGRVGRVYQANSPPNMTAFSVETAGLYFRNNFNIVVLNCSLKNTTLNIDMKDWYDTQFKNIGDTSDEVDIPIALSCLAGTNLKVTVTSNAVKNAANGQLDLTGENKATGIALQLLNDFGKPIELNKKWTQQDGVPQGDYIFNWKARYIKTADKITPGSANATATVNIRYE
ncbi:fimbrial protein [Providencia rettgeri]